MYMYIHHDNIPVVQSQNACIHIYTSAAITEHNAKTYSKYHSILEVREPLITLITVVLSSVALSDLLVAVSIGAGFVETVLRLDERNGSLAAEVVRLVSVTKV